MVERKPNENFDLKSIESKPGQSKGSISSPSSFDRSSGDILNLSNLNYALFITFLLIYIYHYNDALCNAGILLCRKHQLLFHFSR
ncbi:hypothetical protein MKW92_053740, partial [Papaver armeniacum]